MNCTSKALYWGLLTSELDSREDGNIYCCLWPKCSNLPKEQTIFVNLCGHTGRGCRYSRNQFTKFHYNCLCAHSMVYWLYPSHVLLLCHFLEWGQQKSWSYIQQLRCGNFWSQHFKIHPSLEIVTPFQSNSDQKVLIYNKKIRNGHKNKLHSTYEFLWVKKVYIIKILLFRMILKHNWVLSVISPILKWMKTTSCNPKLNMILETGTNCPHWNMVRMMVLSSLFRERNLQPICTLVYLRQNSVVSNAKYQSKLGTIYRGLILSHTHEEMLTWQQWYGKWIIKTWNPYVPVCCYRKQMLNFNLKMTYLVEGFFFSSFLRNKSDWRQRPNLPQFNLFKMRCHANKFLSSKLLNYAKQVIAFIYVMSQQIMKADSSCLFVLPSYVCSVSHSLI